jgi:hypothetical protein
MATNRDLLKEAIADAKAVKETAIANAKAALEEQFSPYLKEKLAAKLAEMDEAEDTMEEAKKEVEEMDYKNETKDMKEADDKEGYEGQMSRKKLGTKKMEEGDDMYEEESLEEMDLEELLAELDGELSEGKEVDDVKEDARTRAEEEGYLDGMKDEKEDMEDDEIDLDDMSEEDLKKFIEDVIEDMVKAGELEAGEDFEDDVDVDVDVDGEIEVEDDEETAVDVDIDENKKSIDRDVDAVRDDLDQISKLAKDAGEDAEDIKNSLEENVMKKIKGMSKDMLKKVFGVDSAKELLDALGSAAGAAAGRVGEGEEEVKEMKREIEEVKKELHEVNLLNSKLLYVNKIFRGKNLTENQKAKVLGAFDKASTVAEVKLVFETLNEGLTTGKAAIKENLGSASKAIKSPARKPIMEVDPQISRWQKLAGIK